MGQGQADIALQLLHDCGRNGEWLCLKNLHLVTAWLPVLEKVSIISLLDSAWQKKWNKVEFILIFIS